MPRPPGAAAPTGHRPASRPVLVDPPPFGSPADLAECVCRLVDELAAVVESRNGQLDALACRVVLRGLGEAHVLLDELATALHPAGGPTPGGAA